MIGPIETILRLLIAALAGSVIGYERERLQWAAGLRTHMLVCVGSCLIVIVSAYGFSEVLGPHVVLDPSRIAAQVVSGIGFLGAGTILLRGEVVKGLTTAASLWAVAAIGLAVGAGLYVAAVATTVIVLVILAGVKPLEERVRARVQARQVTVLAKRGEMSIAALNDVMGDAGQSRAAVRAAARRSGPSRPHRDHLRAPAPARRRGGRRQAAGPGERRRGGAELTVGPRSSPVSAACRAESPSAATLAATPPPG